MNFSELEQIMSARGVTSLADIARALDTTPQAVSNWKSRNKVPFHVIPKLESNISHRLKNKTQLNQNYYKYTEGNNTIAVSEILLLLARQIKTIFIVSFSFVFFTFLYIQFIDEEELLYISSAKVLLEQNNSNSGLTGIASQFGVNIASNSMASDLGSLSLLPDLITSRTFANQILKKEFFTKKYGTKLSLLSILTHGNLEANIGEVDLAGPDTPWIRIEGHACAHARLEHVDVLYIGPAHDPDRGEVRDDEEGVLWRDALTSCGVALEHEPFDRTRQGHVWPRASRRAKDLEARARRIVLGSGFFSCELGLEQTSLRVDALLTQRFLALERAL